MQHRTKEAVYQHTVDAAATCVVRTHGLCEAHRSLTHTGVDDTLRVHKGISRILAVAFAVIGGAALLGCGWDIVDALIQGKGVDFSVKKTSWGMPYGIDVSVC